MAHASARLCLHPRCGVIVPRGYCATHAPVSTEPQRGNSNMRGDTYRWHKLRKRFLDRYPLCGMRPVGLVPVRSQCAEDGWLTPATLVDHVVPHRGNARLFWDEQNWQSLCASCHARKSAAGL